MSNPISAYLKKKMRERRPNDTLSALAKRINIPEQTLYRSWDGPKKWSQAVILMRICSDLNIPMEEAVLMEKVNSDVNLWKERAQKAEAELKVLKRSKSL